MNNRPLSPLATPAFRTLFGAQLCSLMAVGLMTVAMSLAAWRIGGGAAAGQILGLLLAVKMVAYVGLAPLAEALFAGRDRKRVMIALDLGRMAMLIPMAYTAEVWQIAALAFGFFALSAGFTPLFQSAITDVVPQERAYARALVWSRLAYTLESVLSPVIAAAMLTLVAGPSLFLVAALFFTGSVVALLATTVPVLTKDARTHTYMQRALRGLRIYGRTPRLRGIFLLNFALSLSMAWVIVNTVVLAGARLGDADRYFPLLMAVYGAGAAAGALLVPRLVDCWDERRVMLAGVMAHAALALVVVVQPGMPGLFAVYAGFGAAASLVLTPGGLVIARSARSRDRPAVFAAQFSLSHTGWLVAYPLAGQLAALAGLEPALLILSGISFAVALLGARVWPASDPVARLHEHPDLPAHHPHLRETPATGPRHRHSHAFYIDDLHADWSGTRPA